MKTFNINGATYNAKEFTFNDICKMEDMGINLMSLGDFNNAKIFGVLRAYVAICANVTPEKAGELMESGVKFDEVMDAFNYSLENSGFFRSLNAGEEKKAPASKK